MATGASRFRRAKGAVATGLAPAAKPLQTDAGWELIFGEDVENPEVLEQHKFGLQMALLGQGTPEGFVDHEFPAQARSIDGLQGPAVRRGQETLMELLKTVDQEEEDEEEELAPDAPRCPCGRRSRQGRIQLPGAVARRPYFRCAVRACRFFSFGELPVTPEAQALSWVRLRTVSPQQMTMTGQHLVMVGRDGFRPEDARLGPECESLGNTLFVDALAVLTERPGALQKLLPNALATAGCHEIRLCIEGIWRSLLLDERLPMTSSSQASGADKKNFHELLAFGRCAGNQLWIPLLEKAHAKAHGAYQFAFPGTALHVFLEELTGAVVEQVQLGKPSRSSSGEALDPEELWEFLLRYQREGTLLCCVSRSFLQTSAPSAFAVLEMQGQRSSGRALRLRNPRVTGAQATLAYERILSLLRGTPAEASTYADGSFWVQFSDFLTAFAQVCICHASSTGGSLLHTRTFEGDFTPERGVGIRGCSLRLAAQAGAEPCELWFSLLQPIPKGARLLQPSMGQVLNDLSLVVLDASTGEVAAAALFGARQSGSCRVALAPHQVANWLVVPFSRRAWPGAVRLRVHASQPVEVQRLSPEHHDREAPWKPLWSLVAAAAQGANGSAPALRGGLRSSGCVVRRAVSVTTAAGEMTSVTIDLLELRAEGVVVLLLDNTFAKQALLFEGAVEGNFVVTQTSRGQQVGDWCEERNEESFSAGARTQWRRFKVEDVVPPASRQMLSIHFATGTDWETELLSMKAVVVPVAMVGARPANHPFAPYAIRGEDSLPPGLAVVPESTGEGFASGGPSSEAAESQEDAELQLALQLSMQEMQEREAQPKVREPRQRWGRRNKAETSGINGGSGPNCCSICCELLEGPLAAMQCCAKVCRTCAARWAAEQEAQGLAATEIQCPQCQAVVEEAVLRRLLSKEAFQRAKERLRPRQKAAAFRPDIASTTMARLGLKQCPGCGEGLQKESETCHKMICRSCRARFCFRCLTRLEYFNCGCTGAEHRFVDPVDGRLLLHQ